jgi:malonyl-CoA O-methyltransferase
VDRRVPLFERIRQWSRLARGPAAALPCLPAREAYDLWADSYGVDPNLFQRLEAEAMEAVLPTLRDRTVLDLGCGRGRLARVAAARGARRVTATDCSRAMLAAGRLELGALPVAVSDAVSLPFHSQVFDVVVSALMMGHVPQLGVALAEIARVLRPGGDLVLSDFHPSATLRGWVRSFRSPRDGREYAIEHDAHLLADYLAHFGALGLRLEALREPLHQGFPVAFVLRARKAEV